MPMVESLLLQPQLVLQSAYSLRVTARVQGHLALRSEQLPARVLPLLVEQARAARPQVLPSQVGSQLGPPAVG